MPGPGGCLVLRGAWSWEGAWSRGAWSWGVPGLGGVPGPRGCLVPGGLPGGDPPPPDGYCCGRYASCWNAFLFEAINL